MDSLKLRKILSHATIILAGMFVVFFFIDNVNPAMEFISSNISKGTLLLFCIVAIANSVVNLITVRGTEQQLISRQYKSRRLGGYNRDL